MAKRQKRSTRNTQNSRSKRRGRGVRAYRGTPLETVSNAVVPATCHYCRCTFWADNERQKYCTPTRERKLAHLRRLALVDVLCDLLMWRLKLTRRIVQRMVEAAEAALLVLVRRLGWAWDEATKRFEWRAA